MEYPNEITINGGRYPVNKPNVKKARSVYLKYFWYSLLSFLLIIILLSSANVTYYQAASLGLVLFTFLLFIDALGKKLPFREFMAFSGALFWLGAASITTIMYGYKSFFVADDVYYSYAFPATVAMIIGLMIPLKKKADDKELLIRVKRFFLQPSNKKLQFILLFIGLAGAVLNNFSLPGISFFVYLISQMIYVGALYALFTPSISKVWVLTAVLIFTISLTLIGGMFSDLVWWSFIVLMIISIQYNFTLFRKLAIVFAGLIALVIIQQVKILYRQETWFANPYQQREKTDVITENIGTVSSGEFLSKKNLYPVLFRLNQGFFSSLVMTHVPSRQPYVNGETIFLGTIAGFVPRFLWPTKPESGGRENMLRFSGYKLVGNTSIDIGNHMDGYVNFGREGGIVFMFLYGLLLNWLFDAFLSFANKISPTILLWSPFVFIQVIKVETSFVTCFNAAIKGIFFVLIVFWISKNIFKVKL